MCTQLRVQLAAVSSHCSAPVSPTHVRNSTLWTKGGSDWLCRLALALCLAVTVAIVVWAPRYSVFASERDYTNNWLRRHAHVLRLPETVPTSVADAAASTAWPRTAAAFKHGGGPRQHQQHEDMYPLPLDGVKDTGKLCIGLMSDRRYDNYIFRTLESVLAKRTEDAWQLQFVVFAEEPSDEQLLEAGRQRPTSPHSAKQLETAGFTVVHMKEEFTQGAGPPLKYGQALQWMSDRGAGCSVFLVLEDDALASVAWDSALSAALDKLQAHDGMWLWLKLMMPDNYGGWENKPADIALLTALPVLVGLACAATIAVCTKRPFVRAAAPGFVFGISVLLFLLLAGRQNLPAVLNGLAHEGIRHASEPCCIVAQAFNPATVGLISSCMLRVQLQEHTDTALQPCLTTVPQLSRHTYLLLPDLFQHIGVQSSKVCKPGTNCAALRVTGMYLEDKLAADSSNAEVRAAASVPGTHSGWTPAAKRAAQHDVLGRAAYWDRAVPPTGPEFY